MTTGVPRERGQTHNPCVWARRQTLKAKGVASGFFSLLLTLVHFLEQVRVVSWESSRWICVQTPSSALSGGVSLGRHVASLGLRRCTPGTQTSLGDAR